MRADLDIIQEWIKPGSRLLDLGCGQGELLSYLTEHRGVQGYGLEIDSQDITACIKAGINVIQQDLNTGLTNFTDNSFDVVLMTQALQTVRRPDMVLDESVTCGQGKHYYLSQLRSLAGAWLSGLER